MSNSLESLIKESKMFVLKCTLKHCSPAFVNYELQSVRLLYSRTIPFVFVCYCEVIFRCRSPLFYDFEDFNKSLAPFVVSSILVC